MSNEDKRQATLRGLIDKGYDSIGMSIYILELSEYTDLVTYQNSLAHVIDLRDTFAGVKEAQKVLREDYVNKLDTMISKLDAAIQASSFKI